MKEGHGCCGESNKRAKEEKEKTESCCDSREITEEATKEEPKEKPKEDSCCSVNEAGNSSKAKVNKE